MSTEGGAHGPNEPAMREPSLRERLRPVELLVLALAMSVFVGLIVLLATREWMLTLVFFGIAFVVSLVALALFGLSVKPRPGEADDVDAAPRPPRTPHD